MSWGLNCVVVANLVGVRVIFFFFFSIIATAHLFNERLVLAHFPHEVIGEYVHPELHVAEYLRYTSCTARRLYARVFTRVYARV